jgi:hypothetical protein
MEKSVEKTVVGLYDDLNTANHAVSALLREGITAGQINILSRTVEGHPGHLEHPRHAAHVMDKGLDGAGGGALIGGGIGLLASLTALAIPGLGPFIAAGPFLAAITGAGLGALGGGLVGLSVGLGVDEAQAEYYAEGIERGGTIVSVTVPEDQVITVENIMNTDGLVDIEERAREWKEAGWTGYNPA